MSNKQSFLTCQKWLLVASDLIVASALAKIWNDLIPIIESEIGKLDSKIRPMKRD